MEEPRSEKNTCTLIPSSNEKRQEQSHWTRSLALGAIVVVYEEV